MPRLTTYALDLSLVQELSQTLIPDIALLLGCPAEYVTLQANQDVFIRLGEVIKGDPFIEISLFEREKEKEDELAELVTKSLREKGIAAVDIYLTHLSRRQYYENAKHF